MTKTQSGRRRLRLVLIPIFAGVFWVTALLASTIPGLLVLGVNVHGLRIASYAGDPGVALAPLSPQIINDVNRGHVRAVTTATPPATAADPAATPTPTAAPPSPRPTPTPSPKPTVLPTVPPTPKPTVLPTVLPTPSPTGLPLPLPLPIPLPMPILPIMP